MFKDYIRRTVFHTGFGIPTEISGKSNPSMTGYNRILLIALKMWAVTC